MVAETEGARRWTRWDAGQSQPGWIGILGNFAVLLAAGGAGLGSLYFAQIVSGPGVELAATAILALAAVAGAVAGAARWMHAALAARVDILSQALEASPDWVGLEAWRSLGWCRPLMRNCRSRQRTCPKLSTR